MSEQEIFDETLRQAEALRMNQIPKNLILQLKDKKVVMLGEASHGTSEFYLWRQAITKELITNHGFDFICVEGDWPACQKVNDLILGNSTESASETLFKFTRWPTWMWSNHEVLGFVEWLKDWNEKSQKKVGFHGLDVYSFYESIDEVIRVLKEFSPELARLAQQRYSCLEAYRHDEKDYARSLVQYPHGCEQEILDVLNAVFRQNIANNHLEKWLDIRQNAQIVRNAELYYRALVFGEQDSWNIRDQHMMSTLEGLLHFYGSDKKAIVWAHNTHVGDYRATDMLAHGQVNIGGLAREVFGEGEVALVGFGTFSGRVTASTEWDGPVLDLWVPEAMPESFEDIFHRCLPFLGYNDFYLPLNKHDWKSPFHQIRGHRAIGVVYDPDLEYRGNYVPTCLARRYDAFLFIDKTKALRPLQNFVDHTKLPETYPFGDRR